MGSTKTKRGRAKRAREKAEYVPVNDLVVISDTHFGCQMALCPPGVIHLDGGGSYKMSPLQVEIGEAWEAFWEFVEETTKGAPYAVVLNGDAMDGVHHGSTSQFTHNLTDQKRAAHQMLKPVVARCGGRFYMTRGTPAHSGKSAQEEENLAEWLGAVPNKYGRYARPWLDYLIDGQRINVAHKVGTTSSAAYDTSAIHREVVKMLNDAARWGRQAPRVVVRSHKHSAVQTQIPGRGGDIFGCVTACWQLKTPFDEQLRGDVSPPQLGGVVIRKGADGRVYPIHSVKAQIDDEMVSDVAEG